jgi:hypothetical protein
MHQTAIALKTFSLASIDWQIFPIAHIDQKSVFDSLWKFTENRVTLDQLLHPLLLFLKLQASHSSLTSNHLHFLDQIQGKSSW